MRGTVSSAVAGGQLAGAVVLLVDSSSIVYARTLTTDSGTFTVGAAVPGHFHLKVMRLGFRPTETRSFDLRADTTVAIALTDIPFALPTVAVRDRNCSIHSDTSTAAAGAFALWDQARTAFLAAAIALDERYYRFTKLLHIRVYDTKQNELRDVALREVESEGSAPWVSLTPEQLERDGYVTEDSAGMTFYAPDLDVLLSPYFVDAHCFRLTSATPPIPGEIGLDFEPAAKPRHVEIRGTVWFDSASTALRTLRFTFVNLPIKRPRGDTLLGGFVDFERLATGAWILPSWSIRMATPIRTRRMRPSVTTIAVGEGRSHWQLAADVIRVSGGDLRTVKRNDSTGAVLWQRPTGAVRVFAGAPEAPDKPADGAIIRLAGSPYQGRTDARGYVQFNQLLPGAYLFEATTPSLDLIGATAAHVGVTARAGEVVDAKLRLPQLADAAATVCGVRSLDRGTAILAGVVSLGDSLVDQARVTVEWPDGEQHADTRQDGSYRLCGVPTGTLLMIKASRDNALATTTLTLEPSEVVHAVDLHLVP